MALDGVAVLRGVFLSLAATIVIANVFPAIQNRFIRYGARTSAETKSSKEAEKTPKNKSLVSKVADFVAELRVPHRWFYHFYVFSVALSLFWAVQVIFNGFAFSAIASSRRTSFQVKSMTVRQVLLTWLMMFVQGVRRLYECFNHGKKSSSTMWMAHWVIGLVFYFCMSIAVWIEGTDALVAPRLPFYRLITVQPSLRTLVALPLFLVASGIQFDCHHYLSSLEKYSLPTHPIFQLLVCPHYTAECLIYLSLAIAAAPPGKLINGTIGCALVFVFVNLSVTAQNTRQWYAATFGQDKIKSRWNMIPLIW